MVSELRHGLCGKVHSVFENSFNIEMPDHTLIGVLSARVRHCLSINLPTGVAFHGLVLGSPCFYDGRIMRFSGCRLEIDLGTADLWRTPVDDVRPASGERVMSSVRGTARIAYRRGNLAGLGELLGDIGGSCGRDREGLSGWLSRVRGAVRGLQESLNCPDDTRTIAFARSIAGLGPGLTPSGDDLLAGFLGAWWWWEMTREQGPLDRKQDLARVPAELRDCTNVFGWQEVACAAEGELPEVAIDLIKAIIRGEAITTGHVDPVISIGSSSGTDIVAGICAALEGAAQG